MATDITLSQPSTQRRQLLPFDQIFSSAMNWSHEQRIEAATSKLAVALQFAIDPLVIAEWVETLEQYTDDELCQAFTRARKQIAAFPTASQLAEFIEKARFRAAFATVLRGLSKHGVDWQRIPGERVKDATQPDGWRIVSYPVELPALPRRMVQALEYFGQDGTLRGGLVRLKRDAPQFWTGETEYTTGQHGRQASMIERDLWDAWKEADGE